MPSKNSNLYNNALALLKKFYGYNSFNPLQYESIESVVKGNDALVLMPTGGGKSICFQLASLLMDGCTLVVSPLIALMKDQVDALISIGIPAAALNSSQTESSNRQILQEVFNGRIKLLYISPERLLMDIANWSKNININLIAIDEAHCISQWGHDFRPEYTQLSKIKSHFANVPIMAVTATADKLTRADIMKQLGIPDAKLFLSSFDRKNISLNVKSNFSSKQRLKEIELFINNHKNESGIIYCLSRNLTEKITNHLKAKGISAEAYHAGLSTATRTRVQERFLNDETQVMCATIAFGMGINKSNVRWVIHNNMPKNIESYYQEIGRAGRDGLQADTLMFYSFGDMATLMSFANDAGQKKVTIEKLHQMQNYAESHVCRRRILLNYFNERYEHDCGNCDVCNDPPERIDGTVICQMALSAIIRTNYTIGVSMLIDILRGSHKIDLISKGYNKLKTYGVGHSLTFAQWNSYILQMIQLGVIEVAYDKGNLLHITDYGNDILRGKINILLSKFYYNDRHITEKTKKENKIILLTPDKDNLYDILRKLRKKIADDIKVPPFIIFNDKVLQQIASSEPTTKEEFADLYGIGEKKTETYWKAFTDAIKEYKTRVD